jgi:NAD(P)-dependent dehydrogenase (short-subunit alcohol dehydrogenase family)
VTDTGQVEAAAEKVERELGPIDVWVNNAMVTVFAPFHELAPEEVRGYASDLSGHGLWNHFGAQAHARS